MKDLLPFVTNEVGFSVAASLGDELDIKTWLKEYRHIKKVNPAIAQFIKRASKIKLHSVIMAICVYKLLESQAEADRMLEEMKL